MLEALIRIRPGSGPKAAGDVVCVKLSGSPWGNAERRDFLVVEWSDEKLEAELTKRQEAGEKWPVAVAPYSDHSPDGTLLKQSRHEVRLDTLERAIKDSLHDRNTEKPVVAAGEYQTRLRATDAEVR